MVATERENVMRIPGWMDEIRFAFSLKSDGQMSLKRADEKVVSSNRRRFLQANGMSLDNIVAAELVHGGQVAVVRRSEIGSGATSSDWIPGVDGLVTDDPEVLMLTTHADCASVIVYDPVHRVLGQAHAGWRSLRSGIIERLVLTVKSFNGTGPGRLKGWIGPTIRACCYPVGPEVANQFPLECRFLVGNQERLDLARFILMEFARLNLDPAGVCDSGVCTSCEEAFSSFRRDGESTTAMALVTGL